MKAKYIKWTEIHKKADEVRSKYLQLPEQMPVLIERLIVNVGIDIVPVEELKKDFDIEGFISMKQGILYVDNDSYFSDKYFNRLRFTMAHELGHYFLHADLYPKEKFSSVYEWIQYLQKLDPYEVDWIERQADEFAGRILVPRLNLIEAIENFISKYGLKPRYGFDKESSKELSISNFIREGCELFQVSTQMLDIRIKKEGLEDEFLIK